MAGFRLRRWIQHVPISLLRTSDFATTSPQLSNRVPLSDITRNTNQPHVIPNAMRGPLSTLRPRRRVASRNMCRTPIIQGPLHQRKGEMRGKDCGAHSSHSLVHGRQTRSLTRGVAVRPSTLAGFDTASIHVLPYSRHPACSPYSEPLSRPGPPCV